ncbi:MAG: 62, gp24 [Streptosporangiaceae bacterium]|nr:62, gp24 [Streptosporangiaceae bacterium]
MTFRILLTGSRRWSDRVALIRGLSDASALAADDEPCVLVHGDCRTGADAMGEEVWTDWAMVWPKLYLRPEPHPANWYKYGKSAGPIRNSEMVHAGADVCLGFPLPGSDGTLDCMRKAVAAGIKVLDYGAA